MSAIDHLIRVADEFGRASGLDDVTVSWRIFGDSKKLRAMKTAGADIQVRRMERALRIMSEKWPESAVWPSDVPRPTHDQDAAA